MPIICNVSDSNIRYLVWKKDNTLMMITENIDDIFNINKDDIKNITKEHKDDRTCKCELYFNKHYKTPEEIIDKYDKLYYLKLDLLEPFHLNEKDKKIIHYFNSTTSKNKIESN